LEFIYKILKKGGRAIITFPILRAHHGKNYFNQKDVYDLFHNSPFKWDIHFMKTKMFASLNSRLYSKLKGAFSPSWKADRYNHTVAFEMMTNPKDIHKLYKLGTIFLFKITSNVHYGYKSSKRALIIAEKT